eukprot:358281-Chlamydomonas_euryale.AAC.11
MSVDHTGIRYACRRISFVLWAWVRMVVRCYGFLAQNQLCTARSPHPSPQTTPKLGLGGPGVQRRDVLSGRHATNSNTQLLNRPRPPASEAEDALCRSLAEQDRQSLPANLTTRKQCHRNVQA